MLNNFAHLFVLYNEIKTVFDKIEKKEQAAETAIQRDLMANCNITLQLISFGLIKPHSIQIAFEVSFGDRLSTAEAINIC